jgi:hypothetical protein
MLTNKIKTRLKELVTPLNQPINVTLWWNLLYLRSRYLKKFDKVLDEKFIEIS